MVDLTHEPTEILPSALKTLGRGRAFSWFERDRQAKQRFDCRSLMQ